MHRAFQSYVCRWIQASIKACNTSYESAVADWLSDWTDPEDGRLPFRRVGLELGRVGHEHLYFIT